MKVHAVIIRMKLLKGPDIVFINSFIGLIGFVASDGPETQSKMSREPYIAV